MRGGGRRAAFRRAALLSTDQRAGRGASRGLSRPNPCAGLDKPRRSVGMSSSNPTPAPPARRNVRVGPSNGTAGPRPRRSLTRATASRLPPTSGAPIGCVLRGAGSASRAEPCTIRTRVPAPYHPAEHVGRNCSPTTSRAGMRQAATTVAPPSPIPPSISANAPPPTRRRPSRPARPRCRRPSAGSPTRR